jgi:hypothetical protein
MVDDEGRKRVYIGKLNNDFGIWISKRGYDVTQITQPKYFSFTASALTPRIKYQGVVTPTYEELLYDGKKYTQSFSFLKNYPDEKLLLFGYFEEYRNLPGHLQKVIHDLLNPAFSYNGQNYNFQKAKTEITWNETDTMVSATLTFLVGKAVQYLTLYFYVLTNK